MGRRSRAMARRRRSMEACACACACAFGLCGLSKEAGLSAAVSIVSPASYGHSGCKGMRAASASASASASEEDVSPASYGLAGCKGIQAASASEEGKILKQESEEGGKILKLDSLKLDSEQTLVKLELEEESWRRGAKTMKFGSEEGGRILKLDSKEIGEERQIKILKLDSEEDSKILMKVKSEEGKILKLKKEYLAASEAALSEITSYIDPMPMVKPAGEMKTLVVKTLVPPEYIALIKAMPCPVTSPELDFFYDDDLSDQPQDIQNYCRQRMISNMKMRDYHQALVAQYDKFGFAVDETEFTVNEDGDAVEN